MKRSKFSLSNYKLLSCNMGKLVPIGLTEVLPGDTIQQATSILLRVSPLLAPVMHPVHVRVHHWYVPFRLIWNDWENFITGGPDGMDASVFPTKTFNNGTPAASALGSYLGIPTNVSGSGKDVSALPFRAYALIWNENYRDQDLQTALSIDLTDGADVTTPTALQDVCWEKDYFTTARPWTQKGPEVTLPLGTTAPVEADPDGTGANQSFFRNTSDGNASGTGAVTASSGNLLVNGVAGYYDPNGSLFANLESATAASINQLREAFAIQRYEEARARYGSRYVEYLRYLGVRPSDARLQRPEYLGGGRQVIQFSEVLQSSPDGGTGVGNLYGHGISTMRSNRYRKFFEEHGYIMTLLSVKPKTIYADGLARHWNRRTKEDFFQKELQHIGQQEILNKEIYMSHATPDGVWGYQDRYDEYRRAESTIAGEFRDTLDFWHMARMFGSAPSLNAAFVTADPTDRVYQSTATDQLWIMANHSVQARRMVAPSGTPSAF